MQPPMALTKMPVEMSIENFRIQTLTPLPAASGLRTFLPLVFDPETAGKLCKIT